MRHLKEKDYQELLQFIEDARKTATMETMSVESICGDDEMEPGERVDDFIRRKTETWRNSWVIGPLDLAIKTLKDKARRD